ncbi:MAG: hypothetical protein RLZZ475_1880 [Pseudomonadota bacterium]|jgi:hypothetical protein
MTRPRRTASHRRCGVRFIGPMTARQQVTAGFDYMAFLG